MLDLWLSYSENIDKSTVHSTHTALKFHFKIVKISISSF